MGLGALHEAMRVVVLERDGYVCHWCGGLADTSDHHPIPRAQGGPTTLDNLVASCGPCNSKRGGQLGARRRAQRDRDAHAHPFFSTGRPGTPAASPFSPRALQAR